MTQSMRRKQGSVMLDETALKHWVAMVFNQLENQSSLHMSVLINSSGIIHFSGAPSGWLKMVPTDIRGIQ